MSIYKNLLLTLLTLVLLLTSCSQPDAQTEAAPSAIETLALTETAAPDVEDTSEPALELDFQVTLLVSVRDFQIGCGILWVERTNDFGNSLFVEGHICPPGESVFLIPLTLSKADHY